MENMTKFGTSIIEGEDSFKVGEEVARKAMEKAGTKNKGQVNRRLK